MRNPVMNITAPCPKCGSTRTGWGHCNWEEVSLVCDECGYEVFDQISQWPAALAEAKKRLIEAWDSESKKANE